MKSKDPIWDMYDKWLEERLRRFELELNIVYDNFRLEVNYKGMMMDIKHFKSKS